MITALAGHVAEARPSALTARYVDRLVADHGLRDRLNAPASARAAVAELSAADPESAQLIEPLLGVTFSPTILQASDAVNVIPSHASVEVDCRILPGQTGDDVRREVDARSPASTTGTSPGPT